MLIDIFSKYYALQECISNGYTPSQTETDWLQYAEDRIADWASDAEAVF